MTAFRIITVRVFVYGLVKSIRVPECGQGICFLEVQRDITVVAFSRRFCGFRRLLAGLASSHAASVCKGFG